MLCVCVHMCVHTCMWLIETEKEKENVYMHYQYFANIFSHYTERLTDFKRGQVNGTVTAPCW